MVRHLFRLLMLVLVFAAAPVLFAQVEDTEANPVEQVLEFYRAGRIDRAELDALRLLNHPLERTAEERSELYQVLAFIAIAREDPQLGRNYFLQALREMPDLHLDRNLTSPKILAVFDEARADFKRGQIRAQDFSEATMQSINLRLEGAKRSLILPGWGQFYKGNRDHGYAFLGTTLLVGSGLLVSHVMVIDKRDAYRTSKDSDEASGAWDDYRGAWRTRNGLAIVLGVVWAVNLMDALWYPPSVEFSPGTGIQLGWDGLSTAPLIGVTVRF